jgi:hypothetical protein
MKIISQILSLFLSEMKPWQIYMVLVFMMLTFEAGWFMVVASLNHAVRTFANQNTWVSRPAEGRVSLCH